MTSRPSQPELQLSERVLFREIHGEAVLLDLESQRYYGLDEVGTRIWQLLQEHPRRQDVLNALELEYDVDRARLEQDLEAFVERLVGAGLLREVAG